MTADSLNQQFQTEQIKALYEGSIASILASLLVAPIIYYTIFPHLTGIQNASIWLFLICGIALLRAVDAFLYFRTNVANRNSKQFLGRSAIGSTLGAIGWGLMFWNYFPACPQESQFYLVLFTVGIASFATTSLSYHLGITIIFMVVLLAPIEINFILDNSGINPVLSLLVPLFFITQINGARRIKGKFLENIQIQIELKEKEKENINLKYAVDQHNIVSITDVQGKITYANNKTIQISNYSKNELIGANHRILASGEHTLAFWKYLWRTIAGGKVWHGKIKNLDKNGTSYWLDSSIVPLMNENGKPYQYISISTEITKLKELEQQNISDRNDALVRAKVAQYLQGQNALKERITKSLDVISQDLELDLHDKLGVFLIPTGTNQLKLYIAKGQYNDPPESKSKCTAYLHSLCARAVYSGKLVISDHCFLDTKHHHTEESTSHGHYIIPLVHTTKVLGVLFIFTDPSPTRSQTRLDTLRFIGNLLGMAIANETIKNNLHHARKHALEMAQTKSDFLANMSHEIRTPMNGVLGMLDLLKDMPLDTHSKNYVETARSSASMLLNVINDILDISKIESGKLRIERIHFNLRETIENTVKLLSKQAHQKGLKLVTFIPPDTEIFIKGDMLRLQQVINNLISNAIKFTHQGGISITLVTIKESLTQVRIRFNIKDTGIGIPLKKQDALFQAFTQADTSTSREYGGTGLGLTISKKLVEMMGGKIGIISEKDKGSTFWFELPFKIVPKETVIVQNLNQVATQNPLLLKDTTPDSTTENTPVVEKTKADNPLKGNILFVDDSRVNQYVGNEYLTKLGLEYEIVTNGQEALTRRKEGNFDLILMDCQMPVMDGYEATRKIREYEKESDIKSITIIALTANAMQGDREKCIETGMDDYLAKPYTIDLLYQTLSSWLPEAENLEAKKVYEEAE